jgi:hypothetical protein
MQRANKPLKTIIEEATKTVLGGPKSKRNYVVLDVSAYDDESDVLVPQVQLFFQ